MKFCGSSEPARTHLITAMLKYKLIPVINKSLIYFSCSKASNECITDFLLGNCIGPVLSQYYCGTRSQSWRRPCCYAVCGHLRICVLHLQTFHLKNTAALVFAVNNAEERRAIRLAANAIQSLGLLGVLELRYSRSSRSNN